MAKTKTPKPKKDYGDGERPGKEPPLAVAVHRRKNHEQMILECAEQIEPGCPLDPIARAYGLLQALGQMYDSLRVAVDEAVADKIRADGPFVLGEEKFYVGKKKNTKQTATHSDLYLFLMDLTGGDTETVMSCLSSNAWKHGTIKKLLEEKLTEGADAEIAFLKLFEVREEDEVKTGKPTKKDGDLQRIPVALLKRLQQS
jgi:hypothetical protein